MAATGMTYRAKEQLRIRVPVRPDEYVLMPAMGASKEAFIVAIADALKAKYKSQRAIETYVNALFRGSHAVSQQLDDPDERWYLLDMVAGESAEVKLRLFGPPLTDRQLMEEEAEKKRVLAVLQRYPQLTLPQLMYVSNCEYIHAYTVVETAKQLRRSSQ